MKKRTKAGTSKEAAAARRARFVEAYLSNGENGTQAAIDAGFAEKGAPVTAAKLLKEPKVAAMIDRRRKELLDRYELTTEGVLRELARITYFDVGKCYDEKGTILPLHKMPEDTRRALAGLKDGEVRAFDKVSATRLSMQYLTLLPRPGSTVAVQNNVSVASAEVSALETESRSILEVGRRIAYTLTLASQAKQTA